ncbi:MAG: FG-GAP repeat domain-containing protein [Pirellulaceae bacterium]
MQSIKQTILASIFAFVLPTCASAQSLTWEIRPLALDTNEGVGIADFDGDGKLDVSAGRNWFHNPDFVARPLRNFGDVNGYAESNGDFVYDVDQDGRMDVIATGFFDTKLMWFRNPGKEALRLGQLWEPHLLIDTKNKENEAQLFEDIDGDGKPEWIVNSWIADRPFLVWRFGKTKQEIPVKEPGKPNHVVNVPTLSQCTIGVNANGHGMAVGDLNGDGHKDLLVGKGWYESPTTDVLGQTWKYHADWDLHTSVPMLVMDVNSDGRNDLIVGQAHDFGLHWWEQLPPADGKLVWKKHLIDDTVSQLHVLHLADLTGDGKPELITGKRYFAHNGGDPGAKEPVTMLYYEIDTTEATFTRHVISKERVGTGLQIKTGDIDGNGFNDIAVAGKSGTYILFNHGFKK